MRTKKIIATLLAATIGALALTGCNTAKVETAEELNFTGYPIQSETELTYWVNLNANVAAVSEDLGKTPFANELKNRTGVNVKFIHPPAGQQHEQLNIILASDDMPDILEYTWNSFSGGPSKALDDGFIIDLTSVIDKYAPNLKKFLQENPDIDKQIKTDDGRYYCFPFLRNDEKLLVTRGLVVRQDWLDELNLDMPETIDEWHNVLTQFKEKKGAESPLSYNTNMLPAGAFVGAYGITTDFTVDNGKVIYGPYDPRYKDFLTTFAQWYQEGLIDKSIANVDAKALDANVLNGRTGLTFGYAGSGLGKWQQALSEKNNSANLVPAPYVSLNKGETPPLGNKDLIFGGLGAAISTSCKNVELAARMLDFAYSEEGYMLFNFGIEGESYTMENGYPTYTDTILKNSEGLSVGAAMAQYIRACYDGPFVQAKEYIEQYYAMPQQAAALDVWAKTDAANHVLPLLDFTAEESAEISNILNNVKTYVDEKTIRFITGLEDLSNFDKYVSDLKGFGADRMLEIYQAAYERYQKR